MDNEQIHTEKGLQFIPEQRIGLYLTSKRDKLKRRDIYSKNMWVSINVEHRCNIQN